MSKSKKKIVISEGFLDMIMSKIEDRLIKRKMAKSTTLQKANKAIEDIKNNFEKDYEAEFGEKPPEEFVAWLKRQ